MDGGNEMYYSEEEGQEDWTDTGWAQPTECSVTNSCTYITQKKFPSINQHELSDSSIRAENVETEMQSLKSEVLQVLNVKTNSEMGRISLNDNKAGMKGLDKERINQIIAEASKGSRFYENERKKEEQLKKRVVEQRQKVESLSEAKLQQGLIKADQLLQELKASRTLDRHIVHIDMDAFYAAVEMRENPSLRDKPMAVGGSAMLSTSNYAARRFGVRAAMPGFIGKKLCPELIIVPTSFGKYSAVSKQVREILGEYDPNFSSMSLDEAYLDFTHHVQQRHTYDDKDITFLARTNDHFDLELCVCDPNLTFRDWLISQDEELHHGKVINMNCLNEDGHTHPCSDCGRKPPDVRVELFGTSVEEAVREMRFRIEQRTRLTASAGIAPNTMLAKVCSDYNKPNGQYRVQPTITAVMEFVNDLPIRKVGGIGNISEKMLKAVGVELCSDLYHKRALLYHLYSPISFNYFMRVCLGIGSTRIERDGERKSLSTERSFREINKPAELFNKCEELCGALWDDLNKEELMGKTVTLKLKTVGFEVTTRAHTLPDFTNSLNILQETAQGLLSVEIQAMSPKPLRLRLMGVRLSNLIPVSQYTNQQQRTITGMFKQVTNPRATSLNQDQCCPKHLDANHEEPCCDLNLQHLEPKHLDLEHEEPCCDLNLQHQEPKHLDSKHEEPCCDLDLQHQEPNHLDSKHEEPCCDLDLQHQEPKHLDPKHEEPCCDLDLQHQEPKHLDPNHEEPCCDQDLQLQEPKHLDPKHNTLEPTQLESIPVEQNYSQQQQLDRLHLKPENLGPNHFEIQNTNMGLQHLGSQHSSVSRTYDPKHLHSLHLEDGNMVIKENNMVTKDTSLLPKHSIFVTKDSYPIIKDSDEISQDCKQICPSGISELSIAQEFCEMQSQSGIHCVDNSIGENVSTQILFSSIEDETSLNVSSLNSERETNLKINSVNKILQSSDNQRCAQQSSKLSPQKSLKSPEKLTPDKNSKTLSPLQKMFLDKSKTFSSEQSLHTCPICDKEILSKSLNDINSHVDACLEKMNDSSYISMIEKSSNLSMTKKASNHLNGKKTEKNIGKYFSKISNVDTEEKFLANRDNSMTFTLPRLEMLNDLGENTILINEPTSLNHHDHEYSEGIQQSSSEIGESKAQNSTNSEQDKETTKVALLNKFSRVKSDRISTESENFPIISELVQPNTNSEQVIDIIGGDTGSPTCVQVLEAANSQTDRLKYMCPLCDIVFAVSLGRFNDHVDRCLNQPTISTILQETNSQSLPGRKRSSMERSPSRSAPSAKRKKIQTRSIMSYLKP